VILLVTAPAIFSKVPHNKTKTPQENLQRVISRNITCPDFITATPGNNMVRAIVQVDAQGKIKVEDIITTNEQLQQYVAEQLKDMTLKDFASSERFVLIFRFIVD